MINRTTLLKDLQKLLTTLQADLIDRAGVGEVAEVREQLQNEYASAKKAERTAQNYTDWLDDAATQMAAAWVLSCVFVRFLEDNALIDPPRIAGAGERLAHARDEHESYFREHPNHSDRDYLLHVFDYLATLAGGRDVFGPHNGVRWIPNWLSPDGARELLEFFQKIDPATGALRHDFTDPEWGTRFLGDLYQDLSTEARKKYALLQTPDFVEAFILDRTLEPALDEFGLTPGRSPLAEAKAEKRADYFQMIDPACGSGHFLLGAFPRILDRWLRREPATNVRELVRRTLLSINGVDINPFAVAIARFRLLLAALKASGIRRLKDAPAFHVGVEVGDSLYHGAKGQTELTFDLGDDVAKHYYNAEDPDHLREILVAGTYHAVVANPPYITVKDKAQNEAYRRIYGSCHRQYSLSVPFMERIFGLAVRGDRSGGGYTGQITSNSFMKREFGSKLIERFIPRWDLTHVIDTSGAYIPGHGTPTVVLFGRNQPPTQNVVRSVLGIRGEPSSPEDPAQGLVWSSIVELVDRPGERSPFVSAGDAERNNFHAHPWSIGGGGAAELKEYLDGRGEVFAGFLDAIGFYQDTHSDEAFVQPSDFPYRHRCSDFFKPQVRGDGVRDWVVVPDGCILFPFDPTLKLLQGLDSKVELAWFSALKAVLGGRSTFSGATYKDSGRSWYDYHQFPVSRIGSPFFVFASVATHAQFADSRSDIVYNRSAPVVVLEAEASASKAAFLGLLNSSTACFWMKQVFHCKGSTVDQHGARQTTVAFENFYDHDGTKLKQFPIPATKPLALPRELDRLAQSLKEHGPEAALARWQAQGGSLAKHLADAERESDAIRSRMIAFQEELDWECYGSYQLVSEQLCWPEANLANLPSIRLGERAFEIVLARAVASGEEETTWFERHAHAGSRPITDLPSHWPAAYRALVERRIAKIAADPKIKLIEKPEFKRRWNTEPWADRQTEALRQWLLLRLESYFDFDRRMRAKDEGGRVKDEGAQLRVDGFQICSLAKLADWASADADFQEAACIYTGDPAFKVLVLVEDLVGEESVPLLPVLRYTESGLRKRAEWETTWDLQRQEDAIDARMKLPKDDPRHLTLFAAKDLKATQIGDIAVPPKYTTPDFRQTSYWKLRGKLDVPKERWVTFPHCEGADGTLAIAWAGYNHLQLAQAVAAHYVHIEQEIGGTGDPRLQPLLAALIELLPWLKQWHNDLDPAFNMRMGDYYEGFIQEQARKMGKTQDEVRAWTPVEASKTRRKRGT